MNGRLIALTAVIIGFGVLSTLALLDVGYLGIIEPHFRSWGEAQVLADVVILGVLSCIWMVRDAGKRGLRVWPFLAITVVAGSFGPLLYLVMREMRPARADDGHEPAASYR
jgi:Terpene cyclase DEP1